MCVCRFYKRWKEEEQRQAHIQGYSLGEDQLRQDWAAVLALADQKRKSLEQIHVFALAHILRRPIVVYGVKVVKNYRGENLGFVNFEGLHSPFRALNPLKVYTVHTLTHCMFVFVCVCVQGCTCLSSGRASSVPRARWPWPTHEDTSQF